MSTFLNPTVIIEVLSPSTEVYDRGTKFEHFPTLDSLSDYVLIARGSPTVEPFERRQDDKWLLSTRKGLDAVAPVAAACCKLPPVDLYDKVDWPDEETAAGILRAARSRTPGIGSCRKRRASIC